MNEESPSDMMLGFCYAVMWCDAMKINYISEIMIFFSATQVANLSGEQQQHKSKCQFKPLDLLPN